MEEQGLRFMVQKMFDSLVIPKFPEIYEINIKSLNPVEHDDIKYSHKFSEGVFSLILDVHVDGTDEEQENEIRNIIDEVLDYTGFNFFLRVNWIVGS